ncbi:hypothetical protein F5Y16DRAFT_420307 [Xylariaceae sp. FL0255]|nr:hypothetical protein F5Y16DRAFT_420307 [Xylariaceae sp. FL0255]
MKQMRYTGMLASPTSSAESALSTALLLGIFNLLQGDPTTLLYCIETGVSILQSLDFITGNIQLSMVYHLQILDMAAALWLDIDETKFRMSIGFQNLYTGPDLRLASDLRALSRELAAMNNDIMSFHHSLSRTRATDHMPQDADEVKSILEDRLDLFYEVLLKAMVDEGEDSYRCAVLHVYYLEPAIKLDSIDTDDIEQAHSGMGVRQQRTLERCIEILNISERTLLQRDPSFQFDPPTPQRLRDLGVPSLLSFHDGFIQSLFYVAKVAPNATIRSRAIGLLVHEPWRKGAWDSMTMGLMAQRFAERDRLSISN